MGRLTEIRVLVPKECASALECYHYLSEISDCLTSNLRTRLGDDFEVTRDARPVAFGGQWTRNTRAYRDGELRATFSVAYDFVLSPRDFQVSCVLPEPPTAVSKTLAIAASILMAGGATALSGPVAGVLATGSALLAATIAGRALFLGRAKRLAVDTALFTGRLNLDRR